jgi:hypothetical protein
MVLRLCCGFVAVVLSPSLRNNPRCRLVVDPTTGWSRFDTHYSVALMVGEQ